MFLDYDGAGGAFGDTSIQATGGDVAGTSVYAAVDAGDPHRMVIVCINKTGAAVSAGIQVRHGVRFSRAEVYQLTAADSHPQPAGTQEISLVNALVYAMPAHSVSTLVLRP
jgi:hypothetical protein